MSTPLTLTDLSQNFQLCLFVYPLLGERRSSSALFDLIGSIAMRRQQLFQFGGSLCPPLRTPALVEIDDQTFQLGLVKLHEQVVE